MRKIVYKENDPIGSNGVLFVKNIAPYINPFTKRKYRKALFKCGLCENIFEALISNVKKGNTTSCGCYAVDLKTTHGLHGIKVYYVWNSIIGRCENPNNPGYKNYGGRGISICKEWRSDFKLFYEYISKLPNYGRNKYVIDRIDNDGNYEPGNIRWVSYTISTINKRMSKHNKTGFVGVSYCKKDKVYVAQISFNKKVVRIKSSKFPEVAAIARDEYIKANNLTDYKLNLE